MSNRALGHLGHFFLALGFTLLATLYGWGVETLSGRTDLAVAAAAKLGAIFAYVMRERTEAEKNARDKSISIFDWSHNPHALAGVVWAAAGASLGFLLIVVMP